MNAAKPGIRFALLWAVVFVAAVGVGVLFFFREPRTGDRACAERCAAGNFANHQVIKPEDLKNATDAKDRSDGKGVSDEKEPAVTTCRCW